MVKYLSYNGYELVIFELTIVNALCFGTLYRLGAYRREDGSVARFR